MSDITIFLPVLPPAEPPAITAQGLIAMAQPALSAAQRITYRGAAAGVAFEADPPLDQGALVVWRIFPDRTAAETWASLASLWLRRGIAVTIGSETVFGLRLRDVRLTTRPVHTGIYAELALACGRDVGDDDDEEGPEGPSAVTVETATEWGTWLPADLWSYDAADGLGMYLGETTLLAQRSAPDPALIGRYVRLSRDGGILSPPGADAPMWHGVILSYHAGRDGTGRLQVRYRCAGLGHVLWQRHVLRWWELRADADFAVGSDGPAGPVRNPGDIPPLGTASMSADADIGLGAHISARAARQGSWTGRRALEALHADLIAEADGVGPAWTIDLAGLPAAADLPRSYRWEPGTPWLLMWDEVCRSIGCTWSLDVVTGQPVLTVVNLIAAGTQLDLREVERYDFARDESETADEAYMAAPRALVCATLGTSSGLGADSAATRQLILGWSSADRTAWDGADIDQRRDDPLLAHVGRLFALSPQWQGEAHLDSTRRLPYGRAVDAQGQETGAWGGATATPPWPNPRVALTIDHSLPITRGQQLDTRETSIIEAPELTLYPPTPVQVYRRKDSDWVPMDLLVRVTPEAASIELGSGPEDAEALLGFIDDGWAIVVTLALAHPLRPRVSRLAATPPRDLPRQSYRVTEDEDDRAIFYDEQQIITIIDGAPLTVGEGGGLEQATALDWPDNAAAIADLMRSPSSSVSWSEDGIVLPAEGTMRAPGSAISEIRYLADPDDNPETESEIEPMFRCLVGALMWDFHIDRLTTTAQADTILGATTAPAIAADARDRAAGLGQILRGGAS